MMSIAEAEAMKQADVQEEKTPQTRLGAAWRPEEVYPRRASSRRVALQGATAALLALLTIPNMARAVQGAQGALEMDLEFYIRNLLGKPTTPPVQAEKPKEPRSLDSGFAVGALDAVEAALAQALSLSPAALREAAARRRSTLSLEYNRVLTSGAFSSTGYDATLGGSAASSRTSSSSQYDFDLSLLTFFTLLAEARLAGQDASLSAKRLGARLLEVVQVPQAPRPPRKQDDKKARAPLQISELVRGMRAYLNTLQADGYMASYILDDKDVDDALWAQRSALSRTELTVTLIDSASLRAAVLLNGRPGVSPELARPLLTAYLEECGVTVSQATEYFVDSTYRTNPKDYRADQQVFTFTLSPAKER